MNMLHRKIKWDLVGATVSGLCIIHCIALPICLLLLPALGAYTEALDGHTHNILLVLVVGAAGLSFIPGYRVHKHAMPAALAIAGILALCFAAYLSHHGHGSCADHHNSWEPYVAITGSSLLILAHWVNHTKCKKCTEHSCSENE